MYPAKEESMPISLIPSFIFYGIISGITPGPANLCSFSAGIRYGKRAVLRQWKGIFVGYTIVSLVSAICTFLFGAALHEKLWVFSMIGFVYMIWLAIHMLKSDVSDAEHSGDCNFTSGLLVQLTNVKIMIYCITTLGAYVLPYDHSLKTLLMVACILPFIGPVTNLVWIFAGDLLKTLFKKHQKLVNTLLAMALIGCAFSIIML